MSVEPKKKVRNSTKNNIKKSKVFSNNKKTKKLNTFNMVKQDFNVYWHHKKN